MRKSTRTAAAMSSQKTRPARSARNGKVCRNCQRIDCRGGQGTGVGGCSRHALSRALQACLSSRRKLRDKLAGGGLLLGGWREQGLRETQPGLLFRCCHAQQEGIARAQRLDGSPKEEAALSIWAAENAAVEDDDRRALAGGFQRQDVARQRRRKVDIDLDAE